MKKLSELKLTEQAYLVGYNRKEQANEYHAIAIDDNGNNHLIIWLELPDYDPTDTDQSDACNWENPYKIVEL